MASTKVELVEKLEKLKELNKGNALSGRIQSIIDKAKKGMYHDFESEYTLPKHELFKDLVNAGLQNVAEEVVSGEYDE